MKLKRPRHPDLPAADLGAMANSPSPPGEAAGLSPSAGPVLPPRLTGLLLVLMTVLAYLPVFHAGFIWDDDTLLTNNPIIRQPDGWLRFWLTTQTPDYFPLTSTSFWLEWRLWGMNAAGYHVTNVLLHATSALLLWRLLVRLKIPGAPLAAAIFALHPVNVASVAWVAERKDTLAMPFFLLTVLWWLKSEDQKLWRCYWLSVVAFILALLAKAAVAPLPLVLLGLAWWRRGRVTWSDVFRSAAFFGAAGVLALVTIWFQDHNAIGHKIVRADGFWSRLALAGRAVWFYFFKAVCPVGLIPVYPLWPTGAVRLISFAPDLLLAAGFFACWRWRATWGRAMLLGGGYALIMLLPVLGFLNMSYFRYSLVADHWQYFAIIGVIALVAAGITTGLHPFPKGRIIFNAALLLLLGLLTWRQCSLYVSAETLWTATLERNPGSWLAHENLGEALLQEGRADEAVSHWKTVLKLHPGDAIAWYDLGVVSLQTGQLLASVADYEKALESEPDMPGACNNLAWVLATSPIASLRNGPRAVELARRASRSANGENPEYLGTLAAADAYVGNFTEAVAILKYVLQLPAMQSETALTNDWETQLKFYEAHSTFRDLSLTNAWPVNE